MDVFSLSGLPWQDFLAAGLSLYGLALAWRGLWGGPDGERGLIRRRAGTLGRIEGWRLFVFGLALAGVGAAWLWEVRWLLFLSLGIGFVEVREANWVINAWRWDGGRGTTNARRPVPAERGLEQTGGIGRPAAG